MTQSGFLITFEGVDGSGKSTQIIRCEAALKAKGYAVLVTRNPGGTELGQSLRQILLHHTGPVFPTCELLLYMADRAQHMDEVLQPALDSGQVILCDRYIDSTLAYQGYGRSLSHPLIQQLNETATHGRKPDLTVLLDAPPEALASRVTQRGEADRLEREALAFKTRVREGYLSIAHAEPERFLILDALLPPDRLHQQILEALQSRLFS